MKYHISLIFAVCTAILTANLSIAKEENEATEAGFKNLFNGQDLSGWDGDPRLWKFENGVVHGETTKENVANGNTFLIWQGGTLKDFELRLSFRCNATNNSGIQYRSQLIDQARGDNRWRLRGYQHEVRNENTVPNVPSFIYDEAGKRGRICLAGEVGTWDSDGKHVVQRLMSDKKVEDLVNVDGWNEVRILARGNHIQHYLNGKLILDFTDNHPEMTLTEGLLGLQLHAGSPMWAEFKDVRIRHFE